MRKISKISIYLTAAIILAAIFFHWKFPKNESSDLKDQIQKTAPKENSEEKNSDSAGNNTEIASQETDNALKTEEPSSPLPQKYLIQIPFYSQAPLSKWDTFHEEMCEEASILNAAYYLLGKKPSKEEHENELQKMKRAEEKEIGEWKSSTITQIKQLVDIYFEGKIKSKIIESPLIGQIEAEVAAGNPVIVPLSGRDIGNPNFTPPGPVYHMVVVKGYDSQNFITNDVGTRKGESYIYKKEAIMTNIHDWNEKDIHLGEKRALVLMKNI